MPRAKAKTSSSGPLGEKSGNLQPGAPTPAEDEKASSAAPAKKVTKRPSKDNGDTEDLIATLRAIPLERASEDSPRAAVYDTCDDVRRKLNNYIKKTNSNAAAMTRTLNCLVTGAEAGPLAMKPDQMRRFLSKKGSTKGADSPVFYAAYVFFETLRIKEKKPKSKKRKEMEEIWGDEGGFPLEDTSKVRFTCAAGSIPHIDQYGKIGF